MEKETLVIGICGGSGSGKTTVIQKIMQQLKAHNPALLSLDNYYRPLEEQEKDENGIVNFDLPNAIDSAAYLQDLKRLINGESIRIKKYAFNVQGADQFLEIPYSKILLTEGIFLFHYQEAFDLLDMKIYLEMDENLQLERRLKRDVTERGYDENEVRYQWHNHVVPAAKTFIQVHRNASDLILTNDGDKTHLIEQVNQHVLTHPKLTEFCCSLSQ